MTAIAERLPDEVLFMIFDDFDFYEASEMQWVCPAWYMAAHTVSLEDIRMYSPKDVQLFIKSIDSNPHPTYMSAVKTISFDNSDTPEYVLTKEEIQKLFFRFPNLNTVTIQGNIGLFKDLTEELCQEFLKRCPKLKRFELEEYNRNNPQIYEQLYNVRPLLTSLLVNKRINKTDYKNNVLQYITGCSRLQSLNVNSRALNSLTKFLTAVEHLPHLDTMTMFNTEDDQREFAEKFLATKTQEVQDQLAKQLSRLRDLKYCRTMGTCMHSINFIEKYLTGLTSLYISSRLDRLREDVKQRMFFQKALDFVNSLEACEVYLAMDFDIMLDYLPSTLTKIFNDPAISSENQKTRSLELRIIDNQSADISTLKVKKDYYIRKIAVNVSSAVDLEALATELFADRATLENAEKFIFSMDKRLGCRIYINTGIYCKLLEGMSSVNMVSVDIPSTFEELSMVHDINTEKYPLVKDLTINATSRSKFQTLLRHFSVIFPNLQHLSFKYYCGVYNRSMGEFALELPSYTLTSLSIDITSIRPTMKKHMIKYTPRRELDKQAYFILQIDLLNNSKEYLFKVVIDSMEITKISNADMEGLRRGDDYYRVYITVQDLKRFELRRNSSHYNKDEDEAYFDEAWAWGAHKSVVLD